MLTKEYLQTLKPGSYAIFQDNVLNDMIAVSGSSDNKDKQSSVYPVHTIGSDEPYGWDEVFNFKNINDNFVIVPIENVNLHIGLTTGINEVRFQLCNK